MTFVIGIATSLDHRERWRRGREYLYLDRRYSEAVAEAGALPLLLPVGGDPLAVVEIIDALVLPGGDDFVPPDTSGPYTSRPNTSGPDASPPIPTTSSSTPLPRPNSPSTGRSSRPLGPGACPSSASVTAPS